MACASVLYMRACLCVCLCMYVPVCVCVCTRADERVCCAGGGRVGAGGGGAGEQMGRAPPTALSCRRPLPRGLTRGTGSSWDRTFRCAGACRGLSCCGKQATTARHTLGLCMQAGTGVAGVGWRGTGSGAPVRGREMHGSKERGSMGRRAAAQAAWRDVVCAAWWVVRAGKGLERHRGAAEGVAGLAGRGI